MAFKIFKHPYSTHPFLRGLVTKVQSGGVPVYSNVGIPQRRSVFITVHCAASAEPSKVTDNPCQSRQPTLWCEICACTTAEFKALPVPGTPGTGITIFLHHSQSEGVLVAHTVITGRERVNKFTST